MLHAICAMPAHAAMPVTCHAACSAMHAILVNKPFDGYAVPYQISAKPKYQHIVPCHNRPSHGTLSVPENPSKLVNSGQQCEGMWSHKSDDSQDDGDPRHFVFMGHVLPSVDEDR